MDLVKAQEIINKHDGDDVCLKCGDDRCDTPTCNMCNKEQCRENVIQCTQCEQLYCETCFYDEGGSDCQSEHCWQSVCPFCSVECKKCGVIICDECSANYDGLCVGCYEEMEDEDE